MTAWKYIVVAGNATRRRHMKELMTARWSNGNTALFKFVVTPHFGYAGGHAKLKGGVQH